MVWTIYLILLMLIQSSVLEQISTKSLVKITLSEVQLETNFQIILKALKSHDSCMNNILTRVNLLEKTAKGNQGKMESKKKEDEEVRQKLLKAQIEKIEGDVKEMKGNFGQRIESLEALTAGMNEKLQRQLNPESKNNQNEDIAKVAKDLEERMSKAEQRVKVHEGYQVRISGLQTQMKTQTAKISKMEQSLKDTDNKLKELKERSSDNQSNQGITQDEVNKLMMELESRLKDMINEHKKSTQGQLDKLFDRLNEIIKNQSSKFYDSLAQQGKISKKLSQDLWKLNQQLYKHQATHDTKGNQGKNGINPSKISELERRIELLEEHYSNITFRQHSSPSKNFAQTTAIKSEHQDWSSSPTKRDNSDKQEKEKDLSLIKEQALNQEKSNFKKEIIDKLKQQKGDFAKALKKLDSHLKKDEDKKLGPIQQKILRIQYLLDSKVDDQGMKKWMRYIQNKIAYLYRIVNTEVPEQDACIARKNWICLSCDKKLDAYKGKVGTHLASAQLKGKTIEHDVVGGGMLFRSKSRYDMPSIKK